MLSASRAQVETLAEAGSYEDALSLCAMCKVSLNVLLSCLLSASVFFLELSGSIMRVGLRSGKEQE